MEKKNGEKNKKKAKNKNRKLWDVTVPDSFDPVRI
jgi:hypothetical protein